MQIDRYVQFYLTIPGDKLHVFAEHRINIHDELTILCDGAECDEGPDSCIDTEYDHGVVNIVIEVEDPELIPSEDEISGIIEKYIGHVDD